MTGEFYELRAIGSLSVSSFSENISYGRLKFVYLSPHTSKAKATQKEGWVSISDLFLFLSFWRWVVSYTLMEGWQWRITPLFSSLPGFFLKTLRQVACFRRHWRKRNLIEIDQMIHITRSIIFLSPNSHLDSLPVSLFSLPLSVCLSVCLPVC